MYSLAMWTLGISLLALLAGGKFAEAIEKHRRRKNTTSDLAGGERNRSFTSARRSR